jgi:hypothetical protein
MKRKGFVTLAYRKDTFQPPPRFTRFEPFSAFNPN